MMGRRDPADAGAPSTAPACRAVTVVVAVSGAAGGGVGSVRADLDGGSRTVVADDPETIRLFDELECSLARSGLSQPAGMPTAGTLACLAEAARVRPRVDGWAGEVSHGGRRVRLPHPTEELSMSMGEALLRRRSIRAFPTMDAADLSSLLYHAARVRSAWTAPDGYPESSRPSPSAGARHPIDLLVTPVALTGPGAARLLALSPYAFDATTCELVALDGPLAEAARGSPARSLELLGAMPAVVLAMVARPGRTFSRYRGGMSLIYRDAGALLATIGLVATALDLSCCPLAHALPEPSARDLAPDWVDVGGVALGGRHPA